MKSLKAKISRVSQVFLQNINLVKQTLEYTSVQAILRTSFIILLANGLLIFLLIFYEFISLTVGILSMVFVFILSVIFATPYVANITALHLYVKSLAEGKNENPPKLLFLNNIEEISQSIESLYKSWQNHLNKLKIANEKQKETEKMLSRFVASAGHEIRTPLTSVMGNAEIIEGIITKNITKSQGKISEVDKKNLLRFSQIISKESERISNLVDNLLSLSQIEAKRENLFNRQSFNPLGVLQETLRYYKPQALKNQQIFNKTIARGNLLIKADKEDVKLLFNNVVSNAIKYGLEGEKIEVFLGLSASVIAPIDLIDSVTSSDAKNLGSKAKLDSNAKLGLDASDDANLKEKAVSAEVGDGKICLVIANKVADFNIKDKDKLTERFFRGKQMQNVTNKAKKIEGTGLGLAIVKEVCNRHNFGLHFDYNELAKIFSVKIIF